MSEEKKTNKRKLLVRYLILAACILLIAAVTVISICAANDWFRVSVTDTIDTNNPNGDTQNPSDNPDDKPNEGDNPGEGDDPNEGDKPTNVDTTWVAPVGTINVITPYAFTEDVTLKNCWHFHTGLDFAAAAGTPVVCCYDGVVESVVLNDKLDGNTVTVKHANGVKTVYSYIEVKSGLKAGDTVKKGDSLGTVSESTGAECLLEPHVHFEVIQNGESANPEQFLDVTIK